MSRTDPADLDFVQNLRTHLARETSKSETARSFSAVADLIEGNGRSLSYPISLAAIACVLGYGSARLVLKPRFDVDEGLTFNALADLEKIKFLNYLRHLAGAVGNERRIDLFSFDEPLMRLASAIRVKASANLPSEDIRFDMVGYAFDSDLFLDRMPFLKESPKLKRRVAERIFGKQGKEDD